MLYKKGDTVKVKQRVVIPDLEEFNFTDWRGKIISFVESDEVKGEYLLEVEWDSITLNNMPKEYIDKNEAEGFDFDVMVLSKDDVEKSSPRDKVIDRFNALQKIKKANQDYEDDEDFWDEDDEAVAKILNDKNIQVNVSNLEKYLEFLKKEIIFPCILEGIESMGDFGWEERFEFGYGSKQEYEAIRKTRPSLKDEFELIEFLDKEISNWNTIRVKVKRISDNKIFELCLDGLKPVDTKSKNYQLIDTFVVWFVNN